MLILKFISIGVALCIACPAFSQDKDIVNIELELKQLINNLKGGQVSQQKFSVVTKFKKRVAEQLAKDPKDFGPRVRSSLYGLKYYFAEIDTDMNKPSPTVCEHAKAKIILAFSPKSDYPEYVPPEAKAALDTVEVLCK